MCIVRRYLLSLGTACLVLLSLLANHVPARAATPIGQYFKAPFTVSLCDATGIDVSGTIYANVPSDGKTYTSSFSNDVTDGTNTGSVTVGGILLSPTAGEIPALPVFGFPMPPTSPGPLTMPYTFTFTITSFANGVVVNVSRLVIGCAGGVATLISLTNSALGGSVVNPCTTDGRVDGKCGDRIAVYCNTAATPPNLEVWGVGTDSKGVHLTKFVFSDIEKAGSQGIYKNLGKLGVISAAVDSQNNFWVAWNGQVSVPSGAFYADGQPDHGFAKGFQCSFKR